MRCAVPGCDLETFREYFARCEDHLEPLLAQFARRRAAEDRRELPRFGETPRRRPAPSVSQREGTR